MKAKWLRSDDFVPHREDAASVDALSSIYIRFRLNPRGRIWSVMTGSQFSDSHVQHLLGLSNLIEFNHGLWSRDKSHFTDSGFRKLVSHPKLLAFSDRNNPSITDDSAKATSDCSQLRWIHFANCAISNAGIYELGRSPQILALSLNSTAVTDECIPDLCRLTELRRLNLHDTEISDDAIAILRSTLVRCYHLVT